MDDHEIVMADGSNTVFEATGEVIRESDLPVAHAGADFLGT